MTQKQRNYKTALIRSIHTSPLYKDIYAHDRELYEEMLFNRFGVRSSKKLSIAELKNLDDYMNKRNNAVTPKKVYATPNQVSFILATWEQNSLQKDIFSLMKLVRKVTKNQSLDDLNHLTRQEASAVIAAVKNIEPIKAANNPEYKKHS